jgi:hypothetical protein
MRVSIHVYIITVTGKSLPFHYKLRGVMYRGPCSLTFAQGLYTVFVFVRRSPVQHMYRNDLADQNKKHTTKIQKQEPVLLARQPEIYP